MRITIYISYLLIHFTVALAFPPVSPRIVAVPTPAPSISDYFITPSKSELGYCPRRQATTMVLDALEMIQKSVEVMDLLSQPSFPYSADNIAYIRAAAILWNIKYVRNGDQISVTKGTGTVRRAKCMYWLPYIISYY